MSDVYQSLSHSKWDCKYHVVFVPKRRRKAIFGQTRRHLGQIFHGLARQKECQILEGHLMPDHVHMCIAIPQSTRWLRSSGFSRGRAPLRLPGCAARNGIPRVNISGLGAMPFPWSGSNWRRFANTFASKKPRMATADNSEPLTKALQRDA